MVTPRLVPADELRIGDLIEVGRRRVAGAHEMLDGSVLLIFDDGSQIRADAQRLFDVAPGGRR